ncbi:hypothetical protein A9Q76_07730 [Arcobacter sp. 31_11_sub10_T18]|nr:hypothetical protein A9Q76_07730 [Arcobacter sp. 31_11_sub10_T18]
MLEIENLIKNYSCFTFDQNRELLILKESSKGYLIIKQTVEISELLHDLNIIHVVYENNNIQLYLDKD